MNILQHIFADHFEEMIYTLHPRDSVIENVDKMIRYGGLYARHRTIDKKLHRAIPKEKHGIYRSFNQWRNAILSAFGYDSLKCECGTIMLFLELYFCHKRVSLEEMYEKVISRSRGRRSSA